jgi:hypothetical protein
MGNTIQKIFIDPFRVFFDNVIDFLPHLLTSLLILILGGIIAIILEKIFTRLLKAVNLDRFSEKYGISEILLKGGIKEPVSIIFSKTICWLTVLVFLIISLHALNVDTVERLLENLFLYLPNVFIALLIIFVGYILSNFLGRTVLIASVNAGFKMSGIIGKFVQFTVFFLSVAMAFEQLGIGQETVLLAFGIIYGGVVLALAIAFGLGGRDTAKEYIEKRLKGEDEKDDIQHL